MDTDGSLPPSAMFLLESTATKGVSGLVVLFLLFVALGAYFGGTESGLSAVNKIRLKSRADEGDTGARNAVHLLNHFDDALTTLLIGNNITHIAAASVATLIATRLFGSADEVTFLCTVITTLIVFFFSEMLPKAFANDRAETVSCSASGSLRFLEKILFPLVWFFGWISRAASKLSDKLFGAQDTPSITEDELYDIIDTIEDEGVMNEEQGELFKSALDFSSTTVGDVMTMRSDIVALDIHTPTEEVKNFILNTPHSRIPLIDGNLDNIVGVLHTRAFFRAYMEDKNVNVSSLLMKVFTVSPKAKINDLLTEMAQQRLYLGVVRDEQGKTVGLVTIEDFLEELVGEIWDEDEVVDENFIKLGGNYFQVNTHLYLGDVFRRMEMPLPEPGKEKVPVISLLLELFRKIPREEESILWHNIEITVLKADEHSVDEVTLHPLSPEEIAEREVEQ